MAKQNINFNTYVEQDPAKSNIDWGAVSKNLTDNLVKFDADRKAKKAEIEKQTIADGAILTELEQYDSTELGGLALGMSNQSAEFLRVQNDLFKRGLITQTDFMQAKQRVLSDWKQFSNVSKQWNDDYKSYVERANNGEASSLEMWLNDQNVAFGNLTDVKGFVNPNTGRLSLASIDPETGEVSTDPGKHVSMNTINNRFKAKFDDINTTELVKGSVDALGVLLKETLGENQEVYGQKGWGTMKDNADFQERIMDQAKKLTANTNNIAIIGGQLNEGKYTYEAKDLKDNPDMILMKLVNGRPTIDTDASNFESTKKKVEEELYGQMMMQLNEEYTVEKGFEISTDLAEERVRGQIDSQEYRDELAGGELRIKQRKIDLEEEVAAGNMTAQEAATELARDNYDLNVLKYETNDGLVNAQIDKIYADIDLGKDKLELAELTGDRNYKIALMNETYKSKLLKEKEKEGIVAYTYPDPNKTMEFGDMGETTGSKFVEEKLGKEIILSDDYWTKDRKGEVQATVGEYVKGMLDPNVYNQLAEAGGFDVQWNKDDSGASKNELGLVITIGGVKYPFPPRPASDSDIAKLMKEDRSLSREQVEKQINDSNGYNDFTSKGFIPKGLRWDELDLKQRNQYGVQNTEAFFGWINEFVLNPATTAAIALQKPPEENDENYVEKIESTDVGSGDNIFNVE
tara:strand:- start:9388 stop:11451 length:2064 start_codon:yes stop_codon:yes gene_type:complete